ncbi:hypothetical protein GCM10023318_53200 [Nocardia callitridis]|uniref:Uncharacterized protein n=1 Tax=Nocardia callitridis TaxID=648753 RepID=A0ABP9KTV8_9NOCA
MNRDRRTRPLRACRPKQAARRVGGAWVVDDRWAGVSVVPRSVAGAALLDVDSFDPVWDNDGRERPVLSRSAEPVRDDETAAEDESV